MTKQEAIIIVSAILGGFPTTSKRVVNYACRCKDPIRHYNHPSYDFTVTWLSRNQYQVTSHL